MSVLVADILVKAAARSKGLEGYRKILTTNATSNRELRQTFLKQAVLGVQSQALLQVLKLP